MTRVLVVDDSQENRYMLRALLEGHGFVVEEAVNGAEALAAARRIRPDLVVSDLLMPVMDGYTMLRLWKADERLRAVPLIVYTATYTEPRDERLALVLGADAFVVKPAEPEALLARIRDVLARAQAGEPPTPTEERVEPGVLLAEYNDVLVRKLESKVRQLERSNGELREQVAARRQAEGSLGESEERYRLLFHAIADPLFVYDRDTLAFLAVNDAAVAHYGYSRDELLRMSLPDIRPPEDLPGSPEGSAHSAGGRGERRHRKRDGELIDVEISTSGLEYAGRPACVVHARDVTARRRSEEALRLRDRAIQNLSQGVLITDPRRPDNPIVYASAGFERMTGYRQDEVLGRNCRFLQGKDTDPAAIRTLREAIAAGKPCAVELLNYRKDGTPFWNALSLNPVHDDGDVPSHFVGIQSDVTGRRHLEDQLRQSQKMEAVGRLAGGVAHDFNNLLTIISGYSELVLAQPDVTPRVRDSVNAISAAGERAAALTRQLLGFSRRTMLQPKVLDLNAVVLETGKLLRRLIGEDIRFATSLAPDLGPVRVDPGQLDQVLMNLAVNARDAMAEGGTLTIETANVELTEEYAATHFDCRAGPHVMLAMTDTGCGMTPEVIARIFEPFFTTKAVGQGTGLGLAMVFGIVQQSGGSIHVRSEPGHGTTFKLYFPALDAAAAAGDESPAELELRGKETVLLVEDDQEVRGRATSSLRARGYTVLAATDGRDALQMVGSHRGPIDVVVTCVVLPHLGGPELVAALRARHPHAKVLFVSGYGGDAVVRRGLLDAEVSFLEKPYATPDLARRVRQILDGRVDA